MSKNSRKNVVLIVVLSLLIVIKVLNDRSNQTPSELIFKVLFFMAFSKYWGENNQNQKKK